MQIKGYDEVDPYEAVRLSLAAFRRTLQPEQIAALVRTDPWYAYGYGVYAVERGRLLAQAVPLKFAVRLATGVETVGGIAGVCSLPSVWGQGYARRLLEHLHDRFRRDGLRIATLTTSRNLRGHRLYRGLGYVDLAPFYLGTKVLGPRRRRETDLRIRRARRPDLPRVHELYRDAARGLLGWTERHPDEVAVHTAIVAHERACYRVATRGRRAVGYFRTHADGGCLMEEVVAPKEADFRDLVAAIEADSRRRVATAEWITCGRDAARFRRLGYRLDPTGDTTMAAALGHGLRSRDLPRLFGGTTGRFLQYPSDDF